MTIKQNPLKSAQNLKDLWSPVILDTIDQYDVKVAKLHGEFLWHCHADHDEFFYVLSGQLKIEMPEKTITLNKGEMFTVPKGVEHNPSAEQECLVLLFENKNTQHTGETIISGTKSRAEQLRAST